MTLDARILKLLSMCGGNVSKAARKVGVHRVTFSRWKRWALTGQGQEPTGLPKRELERLTTE